MVEIYNDYSDEPEDHFQPITAQLSSEFYNLEMDSYDEDISFYKDLLPPTGSILELGCGSGRITRQLASKERPVIGIDLCFPSLRHALSRAHHHTSYINMDMMQLAFLTKFTAVIAPYNTLNLLKTKENVIRCLHSCRELLPSGGQFLAQVYLPTEEFLSSTKKSFQFQIFERPDGGKIIKEIVKKYLPHNGTVQIEERYRVRPMQPGQTNEDWNKKYSIAAFSNKEWLHLFTQTGFKIIDLFGDYTRSSNTKPTDTTCLLAHLTR